MAITINDQPYKWALRGQKLMIVANSDETANVGFKYGVQVILDGLPYQFYLNPAPDNRLYFDMNPLLDTMRNVEPQNFHFATDNTQQDNSGITLTFTLTEWWIVDGVFTENAGSAVNGNEALAVNGYFQVIDGYKPNVETGSQKVKQSLTSTSSYAMSDRNNDTSPFYLSQSWGFGAATNSIWIPVLEKDYGVLSIPGNDTYLSNNNTAVSFRIQIFSSTGVPTSQTISLNGYDIENLPVYPANLNDWTGLTVAPSLFANWRCYTVVVLNAASGQVSETYVFYNAHDYGQADCNWENMRLGWVNSRGGWDYFNFTKKSEMTNEIERKQYRKVLFNGSATIFSTNDRGLTQRQNLAQQVLTVTSDYITEGEFKLLRGLLVSNQVTWLTEDAGKTVEVPVNIDDTSFVEKRSSDGKLYNVTLKVRLSNPYWT
jgi:hypothetical protein